MTRAPTRMTLAPVELSPYFPNRVKTVQADIQETNRDIAR